jgi:Family of unknown function (DUF6256)
MSSSSLIRQDVVPMVAGYVILMGALATGLRINRRHARRAGTLDGDAGAAGQAQAGVAQPAKPARRDPTAYPAPRPGRLGLTARVKPGWPRLAVHVLATAVGGYLVLMAIIIIYYYGVAPTLGNFVESAFTGCAMLIGLGAPVFAALSWLSARKGWRL